MTSSTQNLESHKVFAERLNGIAAIFGLTASVGAYLLTGQIIPGVF